MFPGILKTCDKLTFSFSPVSTINIRNRHPHVSSRWQTLRFVICYQDIGAENDDSALGYTVCEAISRGTSADISRKIWLIDVDTGADRSSCHMIHCLIKNTDEAGFARQSPTM